MTWFKSVSMRFGLLLVQLFFLGVVFEVPTKRPGCLPTSPWHSVCYSFCPSSNINLVKSLISLSASYCLFSKWEKSLRKPNAWVMFLDFCSPPPPPSPFFFEGGIVYPTYLHCLNSSPVPIKEIWNCFLQLFLLFLRNWRWAKIS